MKKTTLALVIFVTAALVHLFGIIFHWVDGDVPLQSALFISKALLMPALALYAHFSLQNKRAAYHRFILPALGFSWMGDILLTWREELFFLAGLSSFLMAHIFYMLTYYNETHFISFNIIKKKIYLIVPYAIVVIFFLSKTYMKLGWFIIPVGIYSIVLASMSLMALNRYNNVNYTSFILTYIGSLLFMFSDFIIGWTVFYQDIDHSRLIIMVTYITGQFLIIEGLIRKVRIVHIK